MNKIFYSFLLVILSVFYISAIQADNHFPIEINNKLNATIIIFSTSIANAIFEDNKEAYLNPDSQEIHINPNGGSVVLGSITNIGQQNRRDFVLELSYCAEENEALVQSSYVRELKIEGSMVLNEETRVFSLENLEVELLGAVENSNPIGCHMCMLEEHPVEHTFENGKLVITII